MGLGIRLRNSERVVEYTFLVRDGILEVVHSNCTS